MILEMILQRNALYHVYLKEKLSVNWWDMPIINLKAGSLNESDVFRTFKETGYLFFDENEYKAPSVEFISFDEWLFQRQHYDLVDYANYPPEPKGLIDSVKTEGLVTYVGWPQRGEFRWDADRLVKWFDNPDGQWLIKRDFPEPVNVMRNYQYRIGVDPYECDGTGI